MKIKSLDSYQRQSMRSPLNKNLTSSKSINESGNFYSGIYALNTQNLEGSSTYSPNTKQIKLKMLKPLHFDKH